MYIKNRKFNSDPRGVLPSQCKWHHLAGSFVSVIKDVPFECDLNSHFKQIGCGDIVIFRVDFGEPLNGGIEMLWMAEVVEGHWAVRTKLCWLEIIGREEQLGWKHS